MRKEVIKGRGIKEGKQGSRRKKESSTVVK